MKVVSSRVAATVVLFLFFLSCPSASAQNVTPLRLSDAIELAVKSNRQLGASRQGTAAASSAIGEARAAFFPRLDLVEGFTYTDKPTLVFSSLLDQANFKQKNFAIGSLNEPTPLTNLSSQIRLEQPLYTGGQLSARLGQAKAAAQASDELTKRTEQQIVVGTIEAYYTALLAEGNLRVVEKALESARAQLERTRDLYERGLAVRADYLRTQVLMGSLERERIEAENGVTISHSGLGHVLGMDESRFELTDRVNEDSAALEDLSLLKARAKEQRPDLKAAVKDIEKSQESIRAARAGYFPSLGLVTQYESNTRNFNSSGESFAVFVTAKWNLFNGLATQEKVAQEQALHEQARLLHEDLLRAAALEVEKAYLGLITSRKQVVVARENVAEAQEALRMMADRYAAGLVRNVDVLDDETALKKAEQDLLSAQVNSQIFRARLKLATGERP
jgi:outer membrane protein TolC